MTNKISLGIALMVAMTASVTAVAVVPDLIPVKGTLTDKETGAPLDGLQNITFNLYDAQDADTTLWTATYDETTQQVAVANGHFVVYLGELEGSPLAFDALVPATELWLEMVVNGEPMERVRLATVPFAMEAEVCQQVGALAEADIQPAIGACSNGQVLRGWDASTNQPICVADRTRPTGSDFVVVTPFDSVFEHNSAQTAQISNYGQINRTGTSNGYTNVHIPVHLPNGVTITMLTVWVRDPSATSNMDVFVAFKRRTVSQGAYAPGTAAGNNPSSPSITMINTSATASDDIQMLTSSDLTEVVDNAIYDYYLWITLGNSTTVDEDLQFFRARIDFDY